MKDYEEREEGLEPNPLLSSIDFHRWAVCLPRWILRTRVKFAWFLRRSFAATWQGDALPSATFPLPAPHPGCWSGSGPGLSSKKFRMVVQRRLLHVLAMALNYLYLGRPATYEEIGRCPNAWHLQCFERLRTFIVACGFGQEEFPLVPGRSGPELGASLFQLESFAEHNEVFGGGYGEFTGSRFRDDPDLLPGDDFPSLRPYRSLDVQRLKLVGQGSWPLEKFLEGVLWLPYQEPAFLLHDLPINEDEVPCFANEKYDENLALVRLWDSRGLLKLFRSPAQPGFFSRVFNCFKSASLDRQIGDRRLPNMKEYHIDGPSKHLPSGSLLCGLHCPRFSHQVRGSITDRRDFYHQAEVTVERARTNMLPFAFERSDLSSTAAFGDFLLEDEGKKRKKYDRKKHGDGFHLPGLRDQTWPTGFGGSKIYAGFKTLFQGDHLGVEFALQGHEGLLRQGGLLRDELRLRGHHPVPPGLSWEGLIIDDYFAIGAEPVGSDPLNSFAARALSQSRQIYEEENLMGSVEKDVVAGDIFKAAGAEVISCKEIVKRGATFVGAPRSKRLALAVLSLRAARLPIITSKLASRLAGNWVSVLLYRRCFNCIVSRFFSLASEAERADENFVLDLDRGRAEELVLLSCLAPLAASNISLPVSQTVFAVDASLSKGGITSLEIDEEIAWTLWRGGDKKGASLRMDNSFRGTLSACGLEPAFEDEVGLRPFDEGPRSAPLLYFDFVEFFGGAGVVSKHASLLGLAVAPPLDLSTSRHYDLQDLRLLEWCFYMISSGRFRSFLTEPPCTSFSAAAHPCVRSYQEPLGFDRLNEKTLLGNTLAFRSFALLKVGFLFGRPCGKEQPRLSKMCWTSFWRDMLRRGFKEAVIASCQFGSPHKKEFRFLTYLLDKDFLEVKCPGGHDHVPIAGAFTKPSAVYVDALGRHLALAYQRSLGVLRRLEEDEPRTEGLESAVVNDLLAAGSWKVDRAWCWKSPCHINILEASTVVSLLKELALKDPDCRHVILSDSRVAKGALAKGRSSAVQLQRQCQMAGALQAAAGLYPAFNFAPTRLNVADDPSRSVALRSPAIYSILDFLDLSSISIIHSHGLSRCAAGWLRLYVLLSCVTSCSALSYCPPVPSGLWISCCGSLLSLLVVCHCSEWLGSLRLVPRKRHSLVGLIFLLAFVSGSAMEPANEVERQRAVLRHSVDLHASRVVKKETRAGRDKLLLAFQVWLQQEHSISLTELLSQKPPDAEKINRLLVAYGKELFWSGKSYGRFSETINAIASARPIVRRSLQESWDLAFAWLADEPHQRHPALPLSILLGMLTIALMWGWHVEAATLALCWSGVLRIGEVFLARRSDLVLPGDAAPGTSFILLRIRSPKTRGRSANHQAARIDPADFVLLISKVFQHLDRDQPLWPYSASTLRKRFEALLRALNLPTEQIGGQAPFTLGSLRPGGATHLLFLTEDSELTRRRGRWLSLRTMEIYLQEVLVATYVKKLPDESQCLIKKFASGFPQVLQQALGFLDTGIPHQAWYFLFQHRT